MITYAMKAWPGTVGGGGGVVWSWWSSGGQRVEANTANEGRQETVVSHVNDLTSPIHPPLALL